MRTNIYEETLARIDCYGIRNAPFDIDLRHRSLRCGKRKVIEDGTPTDAEMDFGITLPDDPDDLVALLVERYQMFRHSKADEATARRKYKYFAPLDYEDLDEDDRLFGGNRAVEQFRLEYTVLIGIITGAITTESLGMTERQFYWRPDKEAYPDVALRIYRDWLEPKTNNNQ